MLTMLDNSILIAFFDQVSSKGTFVDTSAGGIWLGEDYQRSREPRWAKAVAIGPDVVEVKKGDKILIEPLMWTPGFDHDGIKLWRTSEKHVMAIEE